MAEVDARFEQLLHGDVSQSTSFVDLHPAHIEQDCYSRPRTCSSTGRIEHLSSFSAISYQLNLKARSLRLAVWPPRRRRYYRFEYWKRFVAPFCPYFLRSFLRDSRLMRPADFSFLRSTDSNCRNAPALASSTASAAPETRRPETSA